MGEYDYKDNIEDYFWLILNNQVLGFVDIEMNYVDENNQLTFFIDTECTFNHLGHDMYRDYYGYTF